MLFVLFLLFGFEELFEDVIDEEENELEGMLFFEMLLFLLLNGEKDGSRCGAIWVWLWSRANFKLVLLFTFWDKYEGEFKLFSLDEEATLLPLWVGVKNCWLCVCDKLLVGVVEPVGRFILSLLAFIRDGVDAADVVGVVDGGIVGNGGNNEPNGGINPGNYFLWVIIILKISFNLFFLYLQKILITILNKNY